MSQAVLESSYRIMSGNELLLEWPELKRVIAEGRCELSLTSIPAGNRIPDINDEQLQGEIFSAVNFTHSEKAYTSYPFILCFSFTCCTIIFYILVLNHG